MGHEVLEGLEHIIFGQFQVGPISTFHGTIYMPEVRDTLKSSVWISDSDLESFQNMVPINVKNSLTQNVVLD